MRWTPPAADVLVLSALRLATTPAACPSLLLAGAAVLPPRAAGALRRLCPCCFCTSASPSLPVACILRRSRIFLFQRLDPHPSLSERLRAGRFALTALASWRQF